MKIKCQPEDFQVTELTDVEPASGEFALYRLKKRSIGTLEAVEEIQRRWKLERHRVSWGGLKDRHALTEQYVTIRRGPERNLHDARIELTWLGRMSQPFTPADIAGNQFRIVVRDFAATEASRAADALGDVFRLGVPNYFDDQRFGSLGESGEFIARPWCLGDYERALWLALADPHPDDPADERAQKQILRDLWGRWTECKAALDRSHRRSVVTYLADRPPEPPFDFRGAFARIRVDLRSLYLSAYQSHLWNRMLAKFLRQHWPDAALRDIALQLGSMPFHIAARRESAVAGERDATGPRAAPTTAYSITPPYSITLPLPSARLHLEPGPMLDFINGVLAEEPIELRELRVKYPRDSFFSKGERATIVVPTQGSSSIADDELYPGRKKLLMQFQLPRGAYATLIIKRITE